MASAYKAATFTKPQTHHKSLPVGAGLLAKTVCQLADKWLTHRFREQARSHMGDLCESKQAN